MMSDAREIDKQKKSNCRGESYRDTDRFNENQR
jgi:hypothetical protein